MMSSGCTRLLRQSTESAQPDTDAPTVTDDRASEITSEETEAAVAASGAEEREPVADGLGSSSDGGMSRVWIIVLSSIGTGAIGLLVVLYSRRRRMLIRAPLSSFAQVTLDPTASSPLGKSRQLPTELKLKKVCEETIREYMRSKDFKDYIQSLLNSITASDADFIRREVEAEVFKVVTREQIGLPIKVPDAVSQSVNTPRFDFTDEIRFNLDENISLNRTQQQVPTQQLTSATAYHQNPDTFKRIATVALSKNSQGKLRVGINVTPIFSRLPQGDYWVVTQNDQTFYIVVKDKAILNRNNIETLKIIYDFELRPNLSSLKRHYRRLAEVIPHNGTDWVLEQAGALNFY